MQEGVYRRETPLRPSGTHPGTWRSPAEILVGGSSSPANITLWRMCLWETLGGRPRGRTGCLCPGRAGTLSWSSVPLPPTSKPSVRGHGDFQSMFRWNFLWPGTLGIAPTSNTPFLCILTSSSLRFSNFASPPSLLHHLPFSIVTPSSSSPLLLHPPGSLAVSSLPLQTASSIPSKQFRHP